MKVHIEVERAAKALDQRHGAALRTGAEEAVIPALPLRLPRASVEVIKAETVFEQGRG